MSLQARMSAGDPRLYNVSRDVAHNFGPVMMEVASRLEAGSLQSLDALLKEKGVSEEELGKAIQGLCLFVEKQMDYKESMAAGLSRSGFLDRQPLAQVAVMAHLGSVLLGIHWAGVREATLKGEGPAAGYKGLRWYGYRSAKLMALPRWRRRLYNLTGRFRRAWRAFCLRDRYAD